MRGPGETIDGNCILAESRGDFGLLLWRTVRDVALWSGTPVEGRSSLFSDGSGNARVARLVAAEVPPAIFASVDTIHGMLTLGARADAGVLSICCLEIATWAHRAGLAETAIAFAQAGAVASPELGEAALHTGVYALHAGHIARAETWLRRAVGVSRRERDRPAYPAALVELGVLYERREMLDEAERFFALGSGAARRFSSRSARMRATHGRFRLARARGDTASAEQFALSAQRLYEPDAGGGPPLLLDLARFWTDEGHPHRARAALRRLAPVRAQFPPAGRLVAAALTARAAAAPDGRSAMVTAATAAAWGLMDDAGIPDDVRFAAALDLAHAARLAGDLVAFMRAKRAVLTLAPASTYPTVAAEVAELWPEGEPAPTMERRAS
jgi:tetratricopeptide (TPR) repeat protein